ncbi:hypothetical protein PSYPI_43526, partial [Pseudomonas syringae pv. pisi str. 1704B]
SRTALTTELNEAVIRNGGELTGTSLEDEITLNELFEARMNDLDVQEARREAIRAQGKPVLVIVLNSLIINWQRE